MNEAQALLAKARARESARESVRVPVDYTAANAEFRQQKSALTRAVNSGDRDRVVLACAKAVTSWNRPDRLWPDDWARWQRALDDVFPIFGAPQLEDLT